MIIPSIALADDTDDWTRHQHDSRNSGFSSSPSPQGDLLWTFNVDGGLNGNPAIVNGRVYFGSVNGTLYCLDAESGELIWSYQLATVGLTSPAVAFNHVYVGAGDGKVYCLDADTGEYLWDFQTGDWAAAPNIFGNVYVASSDGYLYSLDPMTGDLLWSFKANGIFMSAPVISFDRIFIVDDNIPSTLYSLDRLSGNELWTFPLVGNYTSLSPTMDFLSFFISMNDGTLYSIEVNDQEGKVLWNISLGERILLSSPVVAPFGALYIGSENGTLFCIDTDTGDLLWEKKIGAQAPLSTPALTENHVYIGSFDENGGSINSVDALSGKIVWSYNTISELWESIPAIYDSKLYIGSASGTLFCFGTGPLLSLSTEYGFTTGEKNYDRGAIAAFNLSTTNVSTGPGVRHIFKEWSSDSLGGYSGPESSVNVVMNNEIIETAHWQTQYYLTVEDGVGGSVSSSGWFDAGSEVTISSTPDSGFTFSSWIGSGSGSYSGSASSHIVTLNGPITETPAFLDIVDPIADAGYDMTSEVGGIVLFNAGGSTDNVGIVYLEWDFGDGTTETFQFTAHVYSEPGIYKVTLTVKDAVGNSAKDTILVTVEDITEPIAKKWGLPIWYLYAIGFGIVMFTVFILMVKYS